MCHPIAELPFWEGHRVQSCSQQPDGSPLLTLIDCPDTPARRGTCDQPPVLVHERRRQRVRDRDCLDRRVWLDVPIRRMDCHHCGARVVEPIGWLTTGARITRRPGG